jgi:hypothetical protein
VREWERRAWIAFFVLRQILSKLSSLSK